MTPTKLKLSKLFLFFTTIILAGLIGYCFSRKPAIKEAPILYKVAEVIDGDTIQAELNNQIKTIRLIGIDTPEIIPFEKCFGIESFQRARELLEGQNIYLVPDSLSSNQDKYGRLLRYVFLRDGLLVNAELIKEGFGFNYIYEPFQFMKQFNHLERQAKENRLGLWGEECDYFF